MQRVEVTNPVAVDADKHAQVDVISMPNVTGTVSVDNIPTHFDVTVDNQIATDPATKRRSGRYSKLNTCRQQPHGKVTVDGEVAVANFPSVQKVDLLQP